MSKQVTFVIKSIRSSKIAVDNGTTVNRLRDILAARGYDVEDAKIRIVRDGVAVIGHVKEYPLRSNDVVVFDSNDLRLQVSPSVVATSAPVDGCSPECCDSRMDAFKRDVLAAIHQLAETVARA
jgi:molybdopterin converting factor small subunit